ncbi:MAG: FKBP-type peptidyl-prolyl cis-trans isomerase [Bacteroidales bacterium]|nr:FKBP-type peptidyl-prolyl cis-trans isomerase [Bacteroidales bacterium]
MDKLSYALGLNIGQQLKQMGLQGRLDLEDYGNAIRDMLENHPAQMDAGEAQQMLEHFFTEMEARQQAAARSDGEAFLNRNKLRPEVTTTASGLQYEVLAEGNGRSPRATDTVRCHYEGTLIDGTVFDSSYRRGEPAEFPLNQVIAGWTEGVQLMKEGAKYRFFIPYQLAYGERGAGGSIPPYAALVFDVELIKVL